MRPGTASGRAPPGSTASAGPSRSASLSISSASSGSEPTSGASISRRIVKRKNEESHFAWVPKEESGLVSRFAELTGLAGIAAGRRLEISPFALAQAELYPEEPGNPFRTGRDLGATPASTSRAG